jgi:hypothetical protein
LVVSELYRQDKEERKKCETETSSGCALISSLEEVGPSKGVQWMRKMSPRFSWVGPCYLSGARGIL